jgi:multiple antibiotic resistance protein
MFRNILMAFIPVFVAVDAIGVLPIFVSLTEGISPGDKKKIINQSILTAICIAAGFILLGKAVFSVLGITVADFMIAGGAILFSLAITDIINPVKTRRMPDSTLGVVPIGTPLIAGPAVLTTTLVIIAQYGLAATLIAVLANILLVAVIFNLSDFLMALLGKSGVKAVSKVTSLLLAAIAVMLIRQGVFTIIKEARNGG